MRRLIHRIIPIFSSSRPEAASFRKPLFETHPRGRTLDLDVFVPGVEPGGVELALADHDLVVTARKARPVRRNWQAAHFEAVQNDYRLRIHLGAGFDAQSASAVLRDGILKIHLRRTSARLPLEFSVA